MSRDPYPAKAMDAARRDYFRQAQLLQKQLGVLLGIGLVLTWLLSRTASRWLELIAIALLLACGGGLFVVSAWLFTRHHPAISVFNDRLWFRGLREQVVMLRNVRDAQLVQSRIAGWTRHSIELTLDALDAEPEQVRIPLDTIEADADEVLELIRERASLQREPQHVH
jgi:hypothetical protein